MVQGLAHMGLGGWGSWGWRGAETVPEGSGDTRQMEGQGLAQRRLDTWEGGRGQGLAQCGMGPRGRWGDEQWPKGD